MEKLLNRLEKLVKSLSLSLSDSRSKNYHASQELKVDNVNLDRGAVLNINMTNTLISLELVGEIKAIVSQMRTFFPRGGYENLDDKLNYYRDILVVKALEASDGSRRKAAERLGISYRSMRYKEKLNKILKKGDEL